MTASPTGGRVRRSFLTGSTTSSNALLASLQAEVAGLLHVPATWLLAAQTAGANVGNSVAPVVVLIGISAVGGTFSPQAVLRTVLLAAAVLMAVVTAMTVGMVACSLDPRGRPARHHEHRPARPRVDA